MPTKTTEVVFVPPIERMSNDDLTALAIVLAVGLGFLLFWLPDIASGILIGYGWWSCVNLVGEANRRRRIAREIREFRRSLDEDTPVV